MRKAKEYPLKLLSALLVLIIALSATAWALQVSEVIDGDTIRLDNGQKVRYIGVNTPETHRTDKITRAMGERARAYNESLVLGKTVRLEFDVQEKDRFGRTLAYVYIDGLFVNAELVSSGYASASPFKPNTKYASLFKKLEQEARYNKKGLWQCE